MSTFIIFNLILSVSSVSIINKDITVNTLLTVLNSPYYVTTSITVFKNVILHIEPGVILKISPKVRISVKGTLISNGNENNRIIFTKVNDTLYDDINGNLRLVDGLEVRQGKLQVKYKNKWRPICSQNREWSSTDIEVACKELGFLRGNFSLQGMAENDTSHMLLLEPKCKGDEKSLNNCPGLINATIGSAVCNLQELVGLHCWGANNESFKDNWWGLTFYNSSIKEIIFVTNNSRFNISKSELSYVDIFYAGVNWTNHRVSALSASPYPPKLSHVKLAYNAYDALNFTDIRGPVIITNSLFEKNHGHGINITSAIGYVHLDNVISRQNVGAGGYIHITSKHWAEETEELVDLSKTICGRGVITSSPVFPFLLLTEHLVPSYKSEDRCFLPISTDKKNQIISIKLLEAIRDPTAEAIITIIDQSTHKTLAIWNFTDSNTQSTYSNLNRVYYGPLYQGISSVSGSIIIRYDWKKNPSQSICPYFRKCFRGILQISVNTITNPEVVIKHSLFDSNIQHGLRIENLGLYAHILNSKFSNNEYGAGLAIVNGSSDLLVHECLFQNNDRSGLNITLSGGTRIINSSEFIDNQGHGLDIWNPTWLMTRYGNGVVDNTVFLSKFQNNLWNGIRFYNSSSFMNILVNFSSFIDNRKNGIEMVSSIVNQNKLLTNFTVGFSTFENNYWHGIFMSPIGQITGNIINSSFTGHKNGGAIYIDNGINFDEQRLIYRHLFIAYKINFNDFYQNNGPFVLFARLSQDSLNQNCSVSLNRFFNNTIQSSQSRLNPRAYTSAVIAIGSSNVIFTRNLIMNPNSKFEISTQMIGADESVDATKNFWGTIKDFNNARWEQIHAFIFSRIFDHQSRYSLAKIEYFPVLKEPVLESNIFSDNDPQYRHKFRNGNSLEVGGSIDLKLEQKVMLEYNNSPYRVTRDIFVPQGAILTIEAGVQLEFENSIGLFVQGSLNRFATSDRNIKMFMKNEGILNSKGLSVEIISQSQIDSSGINLTLINSTLGGGDKRFHQGILRVKLNEKWGVVCDNRFDLITARIACSELGLVAHPMDWEIRQSNKIGNIFNDTIIMSAVRCQSWMTRFDQCEYDNASEHTCSVGIVNVRCHKPGWAGLRISVTNEQSSLSKLIVEEAGLLDYYINEFKPAIQIDFNKHIIQDLLISSSLSDGLLIGHNDMLSFNKITNLVSKNNLGSGIIIKTPWVEFNQCHFIGNKLSGFKFDPNFSEQELLNLRNSMLKTLNMLTSVPGQVNYLSIHQTGIEVLFMPVGYKSEQITYWIELKASDPNNQQQLLLTVIDFNPNFSVENVTIFDNNYNVVLDQLTNGNVNHGSSITWMIPNDLTRFPVISNNRYLTIRVIVNGTRSGRLSFIVQAKSFIELWNSNKLARNSTTANGMMYYFPSSLLITNCNVSQNSVGMTITHYNSATDSQNRSYSIRQSRLNLKILNVLFNNNSQIALYIPSVSPFASDFYFPTYGDNLDIESTARLCRIYYSIDNCMFSSNGNIFLAEHNHVPFSNNVWQYWIRNNRFQSNYGGKIHIQMPFVSTRFDWRYLSNIDHSIEFSNNEIFDNSNFQVIVDGYFLRLSIINNKFFNNNCIRLGLLSLQGMEKSFNISYNVIQNNQNCQYIIEIDSYSQTELANPIMGYIGYNNIVNNRCSMQSNQIDYVINCYTIGVFGNQNVTVRRNILDNKNRFKYELVSGMITNQLENYFDARENYWGTTNFSVIRTLIFDVKDWNNFANVIFDRFLLVNDSQTNRVYFGSIPPIDIDLNNHLGGQIHKNLFLQSRQQPYIIRSDLTVLPGVELRIDAGVILEFMPNIGILVFGKLIARGVQHRPIVMRPYRFNVTFSSNDRVKRDLNSQNIGIQTLRLYGGNSREEGFVQFFNQTAQRWDYLCDDQISKQVGSVMCRQMNLKANNPRIRRSYLVDYQLYGYDNPFVVKYIWNTRYTCRGYESIISDCVQRLNYNAYQCMLRREFVFLRCEKDFLENNERFWGNIRIILPESGMINRPNEDNRSYMEYINITKAGILHGELVSAIQTTYSYPIIKFVNIEKCAWNGIDIIAPRTYVHITNSTFVDNIGYGAAITLLNGDSTDPLIGVKQLLPMRISPMPSSVLGLTDICDIAKDIYISDRLILYYRYSYRTIACTKLIRSLIPNKQIAVRFLQLNLFYDPFTKNSIELFNGELFNSTELIINLNAKPFSDDDGYGFFSGFNSPPFVTKLGYDILGLHLHASPASEYHGFIMEVVTVPISPDITFTDINEFTYHRIAESSFIRNQGGGIQISAVGEMNPVIDVYYNRFVDNGGSHMLNISADPIVLIRLQNCRELNVANNYFRKNRGGLELHLYSSGINRAVRVNFTNNVLVNNTLGSILKLIGNYISTARVERNFFANNDCENRDLIKIQGIIMNPFAYNYLNKNRASVMLNITGEENISTKSLYLWNGFYDNLSINYTRSTTVFCANSKNVFTNNYFRNLKNDFELVAGNRSIMKEAEISPGNSCPLARECPMGWTVMLERNACVCYRSDSIIATQNWWGESPIYFLQGRVWDKADDKYLIPVDYSKFYTTNETVLGGGIYCPPTWTFYNKNCYFYFGAPLDYQEAQNFCQRDLDSVLADSRDIISWLGSFMASWQNNYYWINRFSWNTRAWVHSYIPFSGRCPAIRSNWLEGFQCDQRIQFICQKSPYGVYKSVQLEILIAIILLTIILSILLMLCLIFWFRKSKRRHKAYLIRCTELKHHFQKQHQNFSDPGIINWKADNLSRLGSTINSSSNLYSKTIPVTGTVQSVLSSNRSKYDDDVMKMRRNTLTDAKEAIIKPKKSLDSFDSFPIHRDLEVLPQMIHSKKSPYDPTGKPKSSKSNTLFSGASMEALYVQATPGSQLKLSQPDVPQLFRSTGSRSHLGHNNFDEDISRMHTMIDPLLDPSVKSRNKPTMIRSIPDQPSIISDDSFNTSAASRTNDTSLLLTSNKEKQKKSSQLKPFIRNQALSSESEI